VTEFGLGPGAQPQGIAAGPDGNVWVAEGISRIGRVTPSGAVTEFGGITPLSNVFGISSGPDGNLWFTEVLANRIGRITTTGTVTEFVAGISAGAFPGGITAGSDGNLWFAEGAGRIGRITPSGTVTEFSVGVSPGSPPFFITAFYIAPGPDGNLWYTGPQSNRIGRITTGIAPPAASIPTLQPWGVWLLGLLIVVIAMLIRSHPSQRR
jgi:streptogramin lyase